MPTLYTPEIRIALRAALAHRANLIRRFGSAGAAVLPPVVPPPAPPITNKGPMPLFPRDPTLDPQYVAARRALDLLSTVMNSLGRKGQIVKLSPDEYAIDGSAIDLTGLEGATGTFTDSF